MPSNRLTATELILALTEVPSETVITWTEYDSDRDITYEYGIRGVARSGELLYGDLLSRRRED